MSEGCAKYFHGYGRKETVRARKNIRFLLQKKTPGFLTAGSGPVKPAGGQNGESEDTESLICGRQGGEANGRSCKIKLKMCRNFVEYLNNMATLLSV